MYELSLFVKHPYGGITDYRDVSTVCPASTHRVAYVQIHELNHNRALNPAGERGKPK